MLAVRNVSDEDPNTKAVRSVLAGYPQQAHTSVRQLDLTSLASVHECVRNIATETSKSDLPLLESGYLVEPHHCGGHQPGKPQRLEGFEYQHPSYSAITVQNNHKPPEAVASYHGTNYTYIGKRLSKTLRVAPGLAINEANSNERRYFTLLKKE